jgi:hypothetical protein
VEQTGGEVEPPFHPAAERLHGIARAVGESDELKSRADRRVRPWRWRV